MKRRGLLALALVVAAAAGWWLGRSGAPLGSGRFVRWVDAPVGGLAEPSRQLLPEIAAGPVRNVILIIGDGLGVAQIAAARIRAFGPDGRFTLERLPVTGLVATHPADGLVPKSDSGATAYAAGIKTRNGFVAVDLDGRPARTLVEELRDAGWATGLVTSSYVFDATPAAFVAHVQSRYDYGPIIDQMSVSGVDLLVGGGLEGFRAEGDGGRRPDARDLIREAQERGVHVVTEVALLDEATELPLWALLPGRDLGDRGEGPEVARLAERGLELLAAEAERRGVGFFLLVEEEAIDSASHDLDLDRLAQAVLRLDRAVEAAIRFASEDGATLVLVTGDHSTGGLVIDEGSTADRLRVSWGGDAHGGEPVPLFAYGPADAAARFTGLMDNTEVHERILASLDLAPEAAAP